MRKGIFLNFFTVLILLCAGSRADLLGQPQGDEKTDSKPNILLILTDDQGYHDVSYYGTEDIQTPNIDQLVTSGMRLDNFYTNSPVCSPTRAAIMTGRYPDYVGVPGLIRTRIDDSWGYLDPGATLLPEVLQEHGYHTGLIGKWNLGLESPNRPNERGFDFFHGWLDDMVEDFWEHRRVGINYMRLNGQEINPEGHITNLLTEWSVDYIRDRAQYNQPFFLFLAHLAPHFPVQPPEEWLEKIKRREPGIPAKRAELVAFIEHLDDGIGKVIQSLKDMGAYENTIIVFTSDNGGRLADEANNGPFRGGKQSVYEGGIRVPAGVTWPGNIQEGSSSKRIILTMDLFPTLLEAARISYNGPLNGRSFLPALLGADQPERDEPLFFTRREGGMRYGGLTIQAVRLGDWKLLQNSPFEARELYNLKRDPREQNNLIREYPEKTRELNTLMMKHLQKAGSVPWQKPGE